MKSYNKSSKPIFVVGGNRTGTTWLANILCRHSKIAGVQAERHWGIHESIFFSHVQNKFGDLSKDDDFIIFLESFSKSDYFILSGVDKEIFYRKRPYTYHDFFRILMDNFAENQGADVWLEKTPNHSLFLEDISDYYPDAKFVGIKRGIMDTMKSFMNLRFAKCPKIQQHIHLRLIWLFYGIWRHYKYYSYIENFLKNSDKMLMVEFEDLKNSRQSTITKICRFIGLDFEMEMLNPVYPRNTSFESDKERKTVLTRAERNLIKIMATILKRLPYRLFCLENFIENMIRKDILQPWFFSIMKEKIGKNHNKNK